MPVHVHNLMPTVVKCLLFNLDPMQPTARNCGLYGKAPAISLESSVLASSVKAQ